jgi:hypothetical protein
LAKAGLALADLTSASPGRSPLSAGKIPTVCVHFHVSHFTFYTALMRFVVLTFIAFIVFSLFSALYFMLKDKGSSTRTVKALTVRVVLSITLFVLLLLGFHFGLITQRF